jgi:chaperonin cofactor prefoldin
MDKKNTRKTCSYKKQAITLDAHHNNRINEFSNRPIQLESLCEKLTIAEKTLADISNNKSVIDNRIKEIDTRILIDDILSEIHSIQQCDDEIEYYTKTGDILFNYYDSVENEPVSEIKKTILSFFAPKTKPDLITDSTKNTTSMRADLLDQYLSFTDKDYIDDNIEHIPIDFCEHCNTQSMTIYTNEGIVYCNNCLTVSNVITDNDKPSYKEPPKEISYFAYARINHFVEWLNNIQGKETTSIPDSVVDIILLELKKNRIRNLNNVSQKQIKCILKKFKDQKLSKYYEHIPYIWNRITGNSNPHMSAELEEKLKNMFREMQVPYLKHSPANRKNWMSYSYTLYKLLQFLGENEYLKYFSLLKSREKLHQQELIWKNICSDLGWKFIRSI